MHYIIIIDKGRKANRTKEKKFKICILIYHFPYIFAERETNQQHDFIRGRIDGGIRYTTNKHCLMDVRE